MYHTIETGRQKIQFLRSRNQRRKNEILSECGKEVNENAYVCQSCGCKLPGKEEKSASTISIIGLILSICLPLIGLIVSIIAYSSAKKEENAKSKTFAKAGIIVAVCIICFALIIIIGSVSCALAAASTVY